MATPIIKLNFSEALTKTAYEAKRYQIILPLEEKGGIPSLNVYIDKVGLATIGAGFLITRIGVRSCINAPLHPR